MCLKDCFIFDCLWLEHGNCMEINLISEVFVFLREFCPQDFNRKPRSLNNFKLFKATKFRPILLYDGIVAFKNLIHNSS